MRRAHCISSDVLAWHKMTVGRFAGSSRFKERSIFCKALTIAFRGRRSWCGRSAAGLTGNWLSSSAWIDTRSYHSNKRVNNASSVIEVNEEDRAIKIFTDFTRLSMSCLLLVAWNKIPQLTRDFLANRPAFSCQRFMVVIGGRLLGISKTVVTPPFKAAFDPLRMPSL